MKILKTLIAALCVHIASSNKGQNCFSKLKGNNFRNLSDETLQQQCQKTEERKLIVTQASDNTTKLQPDAQRALDQAFRCQGQECLMKIIDQLCEEGECRMEAEEEVDPAPTLIQGFQTLVFRSNKNERNGIALTDDYIPRDEGTVRRLIGGPNGPDCTQNRWLANHCTEVLSGGLEERLTMSVNAAEETVRNENDRDTLKAAERRFQFIRSLCEDPTRPSKEWAQKSYCEDFSQFRDIRKDVATSCAKLLKTNPVSQQEMEDIRRKKVELDIRGDRSLCILLKVEVEKSGFPLNSWVHLEPNSSRRFKRYVQKLRKCRPQSTTVKFEPHIKVGGAPLLGTEYTSMIEPFPILRNPTCRTDCDMRALRTEYRMLSDDERRRLHKAINDMKKDNFYDWYVQKHGSDQLHQSPGSYYGPAFFPFHREYLFSEELAEWERDRPHSLLCSNPASDIAWTPVCRKFNEISAKKCIRNRGLPKFEHELRRTDPYLALPYWDSTLDEPLEQPEHSILWTDDFFGNGDGYVRTGPFANWKMNEHDHYWRGQGLYRDVRKKPEPTFGAPHASWVVENLLNRARRYIDLSNCFESDFEMNQRFAHNFVGGIMMDLDRSPNDPVFWMLQSYMDFLWQKFREEVQTNLTRRYSEYPDDSYNCRFHLAKDTMKPFMSMENRDGLKNQYAQAYYQERAPEAMEHLNTWSGNSKYSDRPTCYNYLPHCYSDYLFCDQNHWSPRGRGEHRCVSKVRIGGSCGRFASQDICYRGVCSDGLCVSDEELKSPIRLRCWPLTCAVLPLANLVVLGDINTALDFITIE